MVRQVSEKNRTRGWPQQHPIAVVAAPPRLEYVLSLWTPRNKPCPAEYVPVVETYRQMHLSAATVEETVDEWVWHGVSACSSSETGERSCMETTMPGLTCVSSLSRLRYLFEADKVALTTMWTTCTVSSAG